MPAARDGAEGVGGRVGRGHRRPDEGLVAPVHFSDFSLTRSSLLENQANFDGSRIDSRNDGGRRTDGVFLIESTGTSWAGSVAPNYFRYIASRMSQKFLFAPDSPLLARWNNSLQKQRDSSVRSPLDQTFQNFHSLLDREKEGGKEKNPPRRRMQQNATHPDQGS